MAGKNPVDIPPQASSTTIAEDNFSATPVICRQELCYDRHDIYIEFSITNALRVPDEWTIYQDITTLCETTPTSWKLRLILDRPKNLQVVSGDAKIKRVDAMKHQTVGISMEMKVYHQRFGYHTTLEPFDKTFVCGQILFIELPNMVPNEHKDLLLHEKLDLSLRLSIRDCHRPLTPPPKPAPVKVPEKKVPEKKAPEKKSPKEWKPLPIDKRWHHTQR